MKPIVRRVLGNLILLAVCGFLSSCCGLCNTCPEDAGCVIIPSSAAVGIKPTAGSSTPTDDGEEQNYFDSTLPKGSRISYPLFEGDYFTATIPVVQSSAPDLGDPLDHSYVPLPPPGGVSEPTDDVDVGGAVEIDSLAVADVAAKNAVYDAVLHMGFDDPTGGDVLTNEFFAVEPYIMKSGGGDILKMAQINCMAGSQTNPNSFCKLNDIQKEKALIKRAIGMDAGEYLDRELVRFFFYQRPQYRKWPLDPESSEYRCDPSPENNCLAEFIEYAVNAAESWGLSGDLCIPDPENEYGCLNVFIEHTVITATVHPDTSKVSVDGRVFSSYKVTNEPRLTSAEQIRTAYEHLWHIPNISKYPGELIIDPKPALVLLPYGHTWRFDLHRLASFKWPSYRTPQLRYAYRTTLWGSYTHVEGQSMEVSWRAWIDAETGDILQLIPQFAFAGTEMVMAKGKNWDIAPSVPAKETEFRVNKFGNQYCLGLEGVFDQPRYNVSTAGGPVLTTLCSSNEDFTTDLSCVGVDCICKRINEDPFAYLLMNTYSHVDRYQRVLDAALCEPQPSDIEGCIDGHFKVARNKDEEEEYVPLRISINNDVSSGSYVSPKDDYHLVLGEAGAAFYSAVCPDGGARPGAQDATVIIHEFSHIVTDGLLSSRSDNWCEEPACPIPHSLDLVHDLADGFSAIHLNTNMFGSWWSNTKPEETGTSSETNDAPRELNHEVDHFPEHRHWSELPDPPEEVQFGHKEYADGQIAGAAIWTIAESMEKWIPTFGRAELQATLLNTLPSFRFFSDACGTFKQGDDCDYPDECDLDVYRLLHYLLDGMRKKLPETLRLESGNTIPVSLLPANKVLAGFAKTGIFLVPPQCIGASKGDTDDSYCPDEEKYGGDAVIEIDDDWLNHDSNMIPKFRIWTGPRFRFNEINQAIFYPRAGQPCNQYYMIEVANNCEFTEDASSNKFMRKTEFLPVDGSCQAEWRPDTLFWNNVTGASRLNGGANLYYRVITSPVKDVADETVVSSSAHPGIPKKFSNIDPSVKPPFAILNGTGEPMPDDISSSCN